MLKAKLKASSCVVVEYFFFSYEENNYCNHRSDDYLYLSM